LRRYPQRGFANALRPVIFKGDYYKDLKGRIKKREISMKKRNDDFSDSYDDENADVVGDEDDTEESWEDLDEEEDEE